MPPPPPSDTIVRSAYLNRYVSNETLDLRYLVGAGFEYRGYIVESVSIQLNILDQGTNFRLLVNGQVEDVVYMPSSFVTLYPRYGMQLDDEIQSLQLQVDGRALIQNIQVRLRPAYWDGRDSQDYGQYRVELDIYQRMYDGDSLDISHEVDMSVYRSQRLIAVEVEAESYFTAAKLAMVVDSFMYGEVYVSGNGTFTIFPTHAAVVGDGFDSVVLHAVIPDSGVVDINGITLRLSRY